MKNKKGFTLVEIIAVFLVLGIIMILVLPNITGSSSSTKQKAYNTKLELIQDAAVMYGQDFYGSILKEEIHAEEDAQPTDLCLDKQVASTIIKCTIKVQSLVDKDYLVGKNGTALLSNPLDTNLNLNEEYIILWIDTKTRKISTSELQPTIPTDPIPEDEPLPPAIINPPEPEESTKPEEPKVEITLSKIEVVTMPTKTIYAVGENFSKRGMQIRAIYSDNTTKIITAYTVKNGTNLTNGQNHVTISYTENGVTKTVDVNIVVKEPPTLARWWSPVNGHVVREINIVSSADSETISEATEVQNAAADADGDGKNEDDIVCYWNSSTKVLTIAGNGLNKIYLPPDSSGIFSSTGVYTSGSTTEAYIYFDLVESITGLDILDTSKVTNMSSMFKNLGEPDTPIDFDPIEDWDTSSVTDMTQMFETCQGLVGSLDLSDWDTSSVNDIQRMFAGAEGLETLNVSWWDTSSVTNMQSVFSGATGLKTIRGLDDWETTSVTTMAYMFANCQSLTSIDVSNFDTTLVTNVTSMFSNCTSVTSLDLSSINTINCDPSDRDQFAYGCTSLTEIILSENFIDRKPDTKYKMFYVTPKLDTTVYNAPEVLKNNSWWSSNNRTVTFKTS